MDSPADFTDNANDLSSRTITVGSVNWTPGDWNTVGESDSLQKTPDIQSVIQEIVDKSGWYQIIV